MILLNLNTLELEKMFSSSMGETFSLFNEISKSLGLRKLFITKEVLKPNRRLSSKHYHTKKEEVFVVLKGNPTLILNNKRKELRTGDIIAFKPELEEYHTFENISEIDVEFLIIANQDIYDEIIYDKNEINSSR